MDDLLDLTRIRGGHFDEQRIMDAHELIHRVAEICEEDLRPAGITAPSSCGPPSPRRRRPDPIPASALEPDKNAIKFSDTQREDHDPVTRTQDEHHAGRKHQAGDRGQRSRGRHRAGPHPDVFGMIEQGGAASRSLRRPGTGTDPQPIDRRPA